MKLFLTLFFNLAIACSLFAQTQSNAFPSTGNVGIGIASPIYPFQILNIPINYINNNGSAYCNLSATTYNSVSYQGSRIGFVRLRGVNGSPAAVQANDILGWLDFWGSDGSATTFRAGQMGFKADGSPTTGIVPGYFYLATTNSSGVNQERFRITSDGYVGIGTSNTYGYLLAVNGSAIATSMTVKSYGNWPDYVFSNAYQLPLLANLKIYIDQYHHLPDIPSADDVARNGMNLGEMNKLLTKKVEELTLYLLQKDDQLTLQEQKLKDQDERIKKLELQMELLMDKGK